MSLNGYIKYNRSEEAENLHANPMANHLLSIIAYRATRKGNPVKGLEKGECFLGDFKSIGMTRSQYRTAISNLISWGYISKRLTNKGTIAKLVNDGVWDINLDGQSPASRQQTSQPVATNKKSISKDILIIVDSYKELVSYFMKVTGKTIRIAKEDSKIVKQDNFKRIKERIKNNDATFEEMKRIIDMKSAEWKNDKQNNKYLRFETLFAPKNIQTYLNELDNYKPHESDNEPINLISYYKQSRKYTSSKIDFMKRKGLIQKLESKYKETYSQLTEWKQQFSNETINEPFLFDVCYAYLGKFLNSKDPLMRLSAFQSIYGRQKDFDKRKGDFVKIMTKLQDQATY
jgi:uncharacterized phage protein (TIGR02220 family)